MFVGLKTSCDLEKLKKVMVASSLVLKSFYGLTQEDREDIMIDVMYRFEVDKARFPVSAYARHCHNKIVGFLGKKTAQKRMARQEVNGKTVFIEDLSLNSKVGEEQDMEFGDLVPVEDTSIKEAEILADMELRAPELVPLMKKVLNGLSLTKEERKYIKSIISKDDLL